ncbi:LysR family transcriptional regulator [Roseovarius sp.]|uniref:LysR family transcriptional regulator n=1 Tax=Roseovarius sp. TaxID=1486281 RepID=UPI0035626D24
MNVTLKQLRAFAEVARARGFTRAAERCGLSQPALTVAIRQLEEALGTALFERTTRRVRLSADGLAFLPTAERLLAEVDGAIQSMRAGAAAGRERVSVAALPSMAALVLPEAASAIMAEGPETVIHVRDANSSAVQRRVRAGEVDFGLGSLWENDSEIHVEPLLTDRFGLACREDHPLADSEGPLPWAALAPDPRLGFARDTGIRPLLETIGGRTNGLAQPRLELSNVTTAGAMLSEGLGVTAIPYMAFACLGRAALRFRPLEGPDVCRDIALLRRKGPPLAPAAARFRAHILNACIRFAAGAAHVSDSRRQAASHKGDARDEPLEGEKR